MVERSLSMREVRGSIPRISISFFYYYFLQRTYKSYPLFFKELLPHFLKTFPI
ncbi:hypothetical protein DCAR_0208862 [Daucus carota subsp. sativus]|uniref:Uncharacterized protein n=1 Tax=Daucus carota subsp. sativus TaxID=79200 RepID=A0AAF1ANG0_DAUCS|nr:hypothetical protein DCAR_0208862 [Daucus carota subsp. sativus]